jgi:hypothetical protein
MSQRNLKLTQKSFLSLSKHMRSFESHVRAEVEQLKIKPKPSLSYDLIIKYNAPSTHPEDFYPFDVPEQQAREHTYINNLLKKKKFPLTDQDLSASKAVDFRQKVDDNPDYTSVNFENIFEVMINEMNYEGDKPSSRMTRNVYIDVRDFEIKAMESEPDITMLTHGTIKEILEDRDNPMKNYTGFYKWNDHLSAYDYGVFSYSFGRRFDHTVADVLMELNVIEAARKKHGLITMGSRLDVTFLDKAIGQATGMIVNGDLFMSVNGQTGESESFLSTSNRHFGALLKVPKFETMTKREFTRMMLRYCLTREYKSVIKFNDNKYDDSHDLELSHVMERLWAENIMVDQIGLSDDGTVSILVVKPSQSHHTVDKFNTIKAIFESVLESEAMTMKICLNIVIVSAHEVLHNLPLDGIFHLRTSLMFHRHLHDNMRMPLDIPDGNGNFITAAFGPITRYLPDKAFFKLRRVSRSIRLMVDFVSRIVSHYIVRNGQFIVDRAFMKNQYFLFNVDTPEHGDLGRVYDCVTNQFVENWEELKNPPDYSFVAANYHWRIRDRILGDTVQLAGLN